MLLSIFGCKALKLYTDRSSDTRRDYLERIECTLCCLERANVQLAYLRISIKRYSLSIALPSISAVNFSIINRRRTRMSATPPSASKPWTTVARFTSARKLIYGLHANRYMYGMPYMQDFETWLSKYGPPRSRLISGLRARGELEPGKKG